MSAKEKLFITIICQSILLMSVTYLITFLVIDKGHDIKKYVNEVFFRFILSILIHSIVSFYLYIKTLKKLGISALTDENLNFTQKEIFNSNIPPAELVSALKKDKLFKKMNISFSPNKIKMCLPKKWYRITYHYIDIELEELAYSGTKFHVQSEPSNNLLGTNSCIHSHTYLLRIGEILNQEF